MKKSLIILVAFLGFSLGANAQSQKMKDKAMEKVKELNAQIISEDETLALNEEQMEQIMELEIQKLKDMRAINKAGGTEEEKNAKRKEYRKGLIKVLSKEQANAMKAARKKAKK